MLIKPTKRGPKLKVELGDFVEIGSLIPIALTKNNLFTPVRQVVHASQCHQT